MYKSKLLFWKNGEKHKFDRTTFMRYILDNADANDTVTLKPHK